MAYKKSWRGKGRFRGRGKRRGVLRGGRPEKKYLDQNVVTKSLDWLGDATNNFTLLSLIAQGVTASQRVGRRALITSVHLQGIYLPPVASVAGTGASDLDDWSQRIKLWVIQDRQANGAQFAVLNFLKTADINSFRNLNNTSRFKVLASRQILANSRCGAGNGTTTLQVRSVYPFKIDIKCAIPIDFSSTTGAITEQKLNSIHLFMISENDQLNSQGVLQFNTRIRYVDS